MKKVFVSGCYDILHAGHVQFFEDARALGDYLIVNFASDRVLEICKGRKSSLPEAHKRAVLGALRAVNKVYSSSDEDPVFDFVTNIKNERANILVVTEDDKHKEEKRAFCKKHGIEFVVLPKRTAFPSVSTTSILRKVVGIEEVPLRVDFAGGWLDVPKFARNRGFIVNCTIFPLVSDSDWSYERCSGLGGSAARSILDVKNGVRQELELGVGWQDPAVIKETGLCVWRSGEIPILHSKLNPEWLNGKMLLLWTGKNHNTPDIVDRERDYDLIFEAGVVAKESVEKHNLLILANAVSMSYDAQIKEGMEILPDFPGAIAKKYLGGGHGGYALYLFKDEKLRDNMFKCNNSTKIIEPFIRGY